MAGDQPTRGESWHLDKKVPITLIAGMLCQTGAALWWASSINAQVVEQGRRIERIEQTIERGRETDAAVATRLTRTEERLEAAIRILIDIQSQLREQSRDQRGR